MGFPSIRNYVDAETDGRTLTTCWVKSFPIAPLTASYWYDMSMLPGSPSVNDYPGNALVAQQLNSMSPGSIWHGPSQLPAMKHLTTMSVQTATFYPSTFMLCDYVLYYPMINLDLATVQVMNNTQALPRFTDGTGLRMMLITESTIGMNNALVFVEYTNSEGVSGRSLSYAPYTAAPPLGMAGYGMIATVGPTVLSAGNYTMMTPFLPLQAGDTGVRSVQSIRFSEETGGGFATLALVRVLASVSTPTSYVAAERNFIRDYLIVPSIHDDAYLGNLMLAGTNGTVNSLVRGRLEFAWGP